MLISRKRRWHMNGEISTQWDLLCSELVRNKLIRENSYRAQIYNDSPYLASNATYTLINYNARTWCRWYHSFKAAHVSEFEFSLPPKSIGEREYTNSNVVRCSMWRKKVIDNLLKSLRKSVLGLDEYLIFDSSASFSSPRKLFQTPSIRILIQAQINRETLDNRTEVKE